LSDTSWEHAAEARAALNAIVNDPEHGVTALSSAQTMGNLLKDLLPDAPREKSLLVAAAEAGLAQTLRDHVAQGMDATTAIRLTASSFSATTPFTPDACEWVTGEIAGVLGISQPGSGGTGGAGPTPSAFDQGQQGMPTQIAPIPGYTPGQVPTQTPGAQGGFGGGGGFNQGQGGGFDAGAGFNQGQGGGFDQGAGFNQGQGGGFNQGQGGGFNQGQGGGFDQGQGGGYNQAANVAAQPTQQSGWQGGQVGFGAGAGQQQGGAGWQPGQAGYGPAGTGQPVGGQWQPGYVQGGGGFGGPPQRSRKGLYIGGGVVLAVIVVVVAVVALAGGGGKKPPVAHPKTTIVTPSPSPSSSTPTTTPLSAKEPLLTIMNDPGSPVGKTCESNPPVFGLNASTLEASRFCTTKESGVIVWGYQFFNRGQYNVGVKHIEKYVGFDNATPGHGCPPPSGDTEGDTQWNAIHNPRYPQRTGQVLECLLNGSTPKPTLVWTMPTQDVFFIAKDTSTAATMNRLVNWWKHVAYAP
jgi:hypothetical protein